MMGLLLAFSLVACHKEEREVAGAAANAVQAEHKAQSAAQAAASEQDREMATLARIPLPTKSLYANVQTAAAWANPFLTVNADSFTLRTALPGATAAQNSRQHPAAARHQETQVAPGNLDATLVALPPGMWPYGRVIAVAESPQAGKKDRPKVRRNVEAAIQRLNDLGIVVQEWPAR